MMSRMKGPDMANLIVYYSRKGENYWAGSVKYLKKICPSATIEKGLSITGNQAAQSQDKAAKWAKKFA